MGSTHSDLKVEIEKTQTNLKAVIVNSKLQSPNRQESPIYYDIEALYLWKADGNVISRTKKNGIEANSDTILYSPGKRYSVEVDYHVNEITVSTLNLPYTIRDNVIGSLIFLSPITSILIIEADIGGSLYFPETENFLTGELQIKGLVSGISILTGSMTGILSNGVQDIPSGANFLIPLEGGFVNGGKISNRLVISNDGEFTNKNDGYFHNHGSFISNNVVYNNGVITNAGQWVMLSNGLINYHNYYQEGVTKISNGSFLSNKNGGKMYFSKGVLFLSIPKRYEKNSPPLSENEGEMVFSHDALFYLIQSFTNQGNMTFSDNSRLILGELAVLTNNQTITFGDKSFLINLSSTPSLINNGTITITADAKVQTSNLHITFISNENNGTFKNLGTTGSISLTIPKIPPLIIEIFQETPPFTLILYKTTTENSCISYQETVRIWNNLLCTDRGNPTTVVAINPGSLTNLTQIRWFQNNKKLRQYCPNTMKISVIQNGVYSVSFYASFNGKKSKYYANIEISYLLSCPYITIKNTEGYLYGKIIPSGVSDGKINFELHNSYTNGGKFAIYLNGCYLFSHNSLSNLHNYREKEYLTIINEYNCQKKITLDSKIVPAYLEGPV